jgi:RNA polymerase II subunit A small phosphatase-like protein
MSYRNKKLLILDIDETLIFSTEKPLERKEDFRAGQYYVYKRPHLEEFLSQCLEWFEVSVWTSSSPAYAKEILENIFPEVGVLSFVWASDRCTWSYEELQEYYWRKILKKVRRKGYDLNHVITIDDTEELPKRLWQCNRSCAL